MSKALKLRAPELSSPISKSSTAIKKDSEEIFCRMNITKELLIKNKTGGWREKAWLEECRGPELGSQGHVSAHN